MLQEKLKITHELDRNSFELIIIDIFFYIPFYYFAHIRT